MKIRIEAWQNIPHAYSISSQFIFIEMLARPEVRAGFKSIPYHQQDQCFIPSLFNSRFRDFQDNKYINDLDKIDVTLRYYEPLDLSPAPSQKTFIFSAIDWGFLPQKTLNKIGISGVQAIKIPSNVTLITPSQWSKQGLIRSGIDSNQIKVIPLGVDPQLYYPLPEKERINLRKELGWNDHFIFFHVGSLADFTGIRPLLKAFAALVLRYPEARLVLKGCDDLYSSKQFLATASRSVLTEAEVSRIKPKIAYIGNTLSFDKLAQFYQAADAYVSPYIASSFNLPVLEAMATGLPVICTAGGATEDFLHPDLTLKINSQFRGKLIQEQIRFFLHPDWEHLVELMKSVIAQPMFCQTVRQVTPRFITKKYTWKHTVDQIFSVINQPQKVNSYKYNSVEFSSHALLVQGWRYIPHSYALINSHQLVELAQYPNLKVWHQDMPYVTEDWKATQGLLSPQNEAILNNIPKLNPSDIIPTDVTLRVYCPFNLTSSSSQKTFMFGCTEWGIVPQSILRGMKVSSFRDAHLASNTTIITASHWSKQGFLNSGADPERVIVIPLGYDPQVYYPLPENQRLALRQKKRWTDYFVFLNIGVMWNERQGIDRLLKAFAILTEIYPDIRLVLKGRDAIFPSKASIQSASKNILTDAEYERIKPKIGYIGNSLSAKEMAELYQTADCYVSPYSAEGFNLPVLEATACGLPVICTDGGPTDDFIHSEFAWKIESKLKIKQLQNGDINYLLTPDQDHLIQLMRRMIEHQHLRTHTQQIGTKYVSERYTWKHIVKQLVTVMFE
ncbi:MAG: glycosyltransferase [Microcoleaceae cyanobacterium]